MDELSNTEKMLYSLILENDNIAVTKVSFLGKNMACIVRIENHVKYQKLRPLALILSEPIVNLVSETIGASEGEIQIDKFNLS